MNDSILFEYESNDDGTCNLTSISIPPEVTELYLPDFSPEGKRVVSAGGKYQRSCFLYGKAPSIMRVPSTYERVDFGGVDDKLEQWIVDAGNCWLAAYDGILYNKAMDTVIDCPRKKTGRVVLPDTVRTILKFAFCCSSLSEVILPNSIKYIEEYAFSDTKVKVTIPGTLTHINSEAFESEFWEHATICAPRGSFAHRFASKHELEYMPSDELHRWDSASWLERFRSDTNVNYRALRQEVWESTLDTIRDADYTLSDGTTILMESNPKLLRQSRFYDKEFHPPYRPLTASVEISVVKDDCLDAAHKWVSEGIEVSVLNMASRQNPGGGVRRGAGAQEEYLFRCTDYFKSLYRYTAYAQEYGLVKSHHQYPLDRNFGGVFSPSVTVFRGNEENGYPLLSKPWQVNMIAVPGMNSPALETTNGQTRIASHLVEGVKNKIRTIFRIAIDNNQRNLVLGALGCGAFRNPPKHVAELFREVLCEREFIGAFQRICFAVKCDHNSNGNSNFKAFHEILDGFVPAADQRNDERSAGLITNLKKMAIGRDIYVLLRKDGTVQCADIHSGETMELPKFHDIVDIAVGFDHILGLRRNGKVVCGGERSQGVHAQSLHWWGGDKLFACEAHSAMLMPNGTVIGAEDNGFECISYNHVFKNWQNIADIALTFDFPMGMTTNGNVLIGKNSYIDIPEEFRKNAVQIAAFGCYYSQTTIAILSRSGTVYASIDGKPLEDVGKWGHIVKVVCGNCFAASLDKSGRVNFSSGLRYQDSSGNAIESLSDIVDIAANFNHFFALGRNGKLIYVHAG